MNDNQVNPNNLLDATDCLEAIGVIRGWKNFLFIIVILSLLIIQISFWLVNTGYIEIGKSAQTSQQAVPIAPNSVNQIPATVETIITPATEETRESESEAFIQQLLGEPNDQNAVSPESEPADMKTGDISDSQQSQPQTAQTSQSGFVSTAVHKTDYFSVMLRFVDAVLILTSVLYCLTLLLGLKISLLGRLGGINHICRAFFLSLVALILLLPWQYVFGRFVLGAAFGPLELRNWYLADNSGILSSIMYYLRFTGYWLLVLLLFIFAQIRSLRWAKAILRRLDII